MPEEKTLAAKIWDLHNQGHGRAEITKRTGCTQAYYYQVLSARKKPPTTLERIENMEITMIECLARLRLLTADQDGVALQQMMDKIEADLSTAAVSRRRSLEWEKRKAFDRQLRYQISKRQGIAAPPPVAKETPPLPAAIEDSSIEDLLGITGLTS